MLTYAASISNNGLELLFTRTNPAGGDPAIYRAVRTKVGWAFGHVQRVGAATGFVEAPAISTDGTTLYYHELVGGTFRYGLSPGLRQRPGGFRRQQTIPRY